MSIPKLSAYLTIHNYVPFTLSPGPNSIPQGTALWTNASIPRDGVFTSGWGAISMCSLQENLDDESWRHTNWQTATTNGINGVATWRVFHSNNTTTTITIRAHVHENAPHFVSASSDQPTIVAVSVGDYQPEVFPLKGMKYSTSGLCISYWTFLTFIYYIWKIQPISLFVPMLAPPLHPPRNCLRTSPLETNLRSRLLDKPKTMSGLRSARTRKQRDICGF